MSLYGAALYGVAFHRNFVFQTRPYSAADFMFWGASSKSDYLVSKVFAVDDESFSLDLDLSVRYGWS